jgi:CDGSH-type Zn-finger protein
MHGRRAPDEGLLMNEPRGSEPKIVVRKGGPYRVSGGLPLRRTAIVYTQYGEPVDVDEGPEFKTGKMYELCRCGQSSTKPFCDTTHEKVGFRGTESADRGPIARRQQVFEGEGVTMYDDRSLCTHAGFCGDRFTNVWEMIEDTADPEIRERLMAMVRRCPSGRLSYSVPPDPAAVEPEFEPMIGIEPDGPLWVRGGVRIESEDGRNYEVRNRMTLCRCGRSRNKPFCDGTHEIVGFRDPGMPPDTTPPTSALSNDA